MAEGWIKVSRQMVNHWLWSYTPFSYGQAWIDLLLLANFEDSKMIYKGNLITCKRGDVNFSLSYLADRWNWDRRTVKKFIDILEADGMVIANVTKQRTTITIVNYSLFQDSSTTKCTTECTSDVQAMHIIKKDKKEKKKKNIYGEHKNVKLTDEEFEKIKAEFPDDYQQKIENLSFYMYNNKKSYADHYLTILNWARKDKEKGIPAKKNSFNQHQQADYDFDELEKLLGGS